MADYRPLLTFLGVPWTYDDRSWQFVVPKLVIGIVVAFFFRRDESLLHYVVMGLIYGVLLNLSAALHIVGHIASSKLVAPPMTEARITPRLIQTRYDADPEQVAPRVHLLRSIGGPLMNVLLGGLGLLLWQVTGHPVALFFMLFNWILTVILLLPFATVDGEVIWRELPKLRR
jgi:hypothetical protein